MHLSTSLGVQQCCHTCHPPLPCLPLWMWNFSKYYTALCKALSAWVSFDKVRGSSALPKQPQEEGKALPGRLGTPLRDSGDAVHVKTPNLFFTFHSSTFFFSWKIFNTEAIICSLFLLPLAFLCYINQLIFKVIFWHKDIDKLGTKMLWATFQSSGKASWW